MNISQTLTHQLENASWIRRMFEEGARLKRERGAENICDYTLGNPDVEPPEAMLEALRRAASAPRRHGHAYMANVGYEHTRAAVAARLAAQSCLPFEARHVIMTVGSAGACNTILKSILDPGDEVIVFLPCFSEYPFYVTNHAGVMVAVDTDETFLPDLEKLAAAITPRTRAIILNSPNNPTGRVYPAETLDAIEAIVKRAAQPILVISDEPYRNLVYDGAAFPDVSARISQSVVCNSWSKCSAIPGERIGYLAFSPRLEGYEPLFNACAFTNRILGFINAPAIWQHVIAEAANELIDISSYEARRNRLCEGLRAIGYDAPSPEGTFYAFPKSPIADDIAFIRTLARHNVLGVPGTGFRRPGYFRLSFTVEMEVIDRSMAGFKAAFDELRG